MEILMCNNSKLGMFIGKCVRCGCIAEAKEDELIMIGGDILAEFANLAHGDCPCCSSKNSMMFFPRKSKLGKKIESMVY